MKKKSILSILDSLEKINTSVIRNLEANIQIPVETLIDCQDSAVAIGNEVEKQGAVGEETVHLLEDYCENLYQMSCEQADLIKCRKLAKKIQKQLVRIRNHVKYDLPDDKKQAVFLPYKASMWDSLESVWLAADADSDYDTYVIPIPYYDKNADGTFGKMHYEGKEFPEYVPITGYEDYDFETNQPDVVFIHNPYDESNFVTSVHPFFYTKNLKKFTDKLVYISYFILGEVMYESMCVSPGTVFSDIVIAHSVSAKEDYVRHLKKLYMENAGMREGEAEKILREKILPMGSPKIDKVVNGRREDYALPEKWKKLLDGRKAVLYNTGVSGILHGNEQELKKIRDTITFFAGRGDVVLWWRPHPLSGGTMQAMRPEILEEYQGIVEEYKRSGIGIYDDTADLHRAVLWTDMYYGDDSSLIYLYGVLGKPIVMQNIGLLTEQRTAGADSGICYRAFCNVSDSIFFSALYYNRLYRLDLTQKAVADLGEVPQEWQMETSLHSNIIYWKDILWLVPSRAHALSAYHLDTGEWERYELRDRIKNSRRIEEKIYMLSSDYKRLWIMDLEEKKLEREDIVYRQKEKFCLSDEYYNDDLYIVDRKIYYLIIHTNMLAVYDLESREAELMHIGTEENVYQRMLYDGKGFWFFPRNEKTKIAYWDGLNLRESDSDCYPQGFSFQWGFSHAIFQNDKIWLFPLKGNMILQLDTETLETACVLAQEESIETLSALLLSNGRVAFSAIKTLSQGENREMILDSDGKVLENYTAECSDSFPINAERMFEKMETEKYSSGNPYQIKETREYSLSFACDALVKGKGVYKAESEYFRSLYANSDGTAGSHIWEEVKV